VVFFLECSCVASNLKLNVWCMEKTPYLSEMFYHQRMSTAAFICEQTEILNKQNSSK
jgi:hypothetical protein